MMLFNIEGSFKYKDTNITKLTHQTSIAIEKYQKKFISWIQALENRIWLQWKVNIVIVVALD